MAEEKNPRTIWESEEVCEVAGTYFAKCCAARFEAYLHVGDLFPLCPGCRKLIQWERIVRAE